MCVCEHERCLFKKNVHQKKWITEIENDCEFSVYAGNMHPLSSTMERKHLQNQIDTMGDIKPEKYGSTNSLDNAGRDNIRKR